MTEIHILPVRPHGAEQATRLLADLTNAHARGQDLGSRVVHIRVGGEALQKLSVQFPNQIEDLERLLGLNGLQNHVCLALRLRFSVCCLSGSFPGLQVLLPPFGICGTAFEMRSVCDRLMRPSPERPCDDVSGLNTPLREADRDAADLLHRPADQGGAWPRPSPSFLGRCVGVMADHCQQGEGHHHQADVSVPAMPGAGLVVSEPEFGLGHFECTLDAPTSSLDADQGLDRRASRAPGGEVGLRAVSQAAPDQEPPRPQASLVVGGTIEVGSFAGGPIVQPRALRSVARRQARPGRRSEAVRVRLAVPATGGLSIQDLNR